MIVTKEPPGSKILIIGEIMGKMGSWVSVWNSKYYLLSYTINLKLYFFKSVKNKTYPQNDGGSRVPQLHHTLIYSVLTAWGAPS